MTDQEIIDSAPEGASVSDITGQYFDEYNNHLNSQGFWSEKDTSPISPRSLVDIKRIIELESNQMRAETVITELHVDGASPYLDNRVALYFAIKEQE